MKDLLITQHVWGSYKGYIPFFLLFLGLSYPEYDALIYVYDELDESTKGQLEVVKSVYNQFKIKIVDKKHRLFSETAVKNAQVAKSQRWLMYDEEFENYEAVYTGDVDILIFRESKPLYQAHIEHCEKMGLCYSNMEREPELNDPHTVMRFLRDVKYYGPVKAVKYTITAPKYNYKYSGLHFVRSKEYYAALRPVFGRYVHEIENMVALKKSIFNIKTFSNEVLLRTMIVSSGIGALPHEEKYRPYHGLHIGRYRDIPLGEESDFYEETYGYYRQYKEIKVLEEFQRLFMNAPEFVKKTFNNMEKSYGEYERVLQI